MDLHTRLLVSDFKACFRFYRDVMGLQPTFGTEDGTYADFKIGEGTLALFDKHEMAEAVGTANQPAQSNSQDSVCLVFGVKNVDETCQQMVAKGANCVTKPTDHPDWGIRAAHFRDPDGNLIEINQSLQRS
jgi:predicted enzyme related to lactoylglutathione lyase